MTPLPAKCAAMAVRTVLRMSETINRKITPKTIAREKKRFLMVSQMPALGSGWTSQMVLSES